MITVTSALRIHLLALAALLAVCSVERALAESEAASPWHEGANSRIRLISAAGIAYQGRLVTAGGLEFSLDEGWKTYWRTPGDGLPTSVDWTGSENLRKAEILWPAPKRLSSSEGLVSYVYADRVVLPILITPEDGTKSVLLRLQVSYGVCADICIPAEASLQLAVPTTPEGTYRDAIREALDRVPKQQGRGVYCPHSVITAKRRIVSGKPALLVKTAFDDGATGLDLFAEAPEGFDLPAPVRQPRASRGRHYYIIRFDSAAALKALAGQALIFTTVSNQGSCEIVWRVK